MNKFNECLLVTNNYELCKALKSNARLGGKSYEFIDGSALDVLIAVRDYVHRGYALLTHPLCGNLRPYQQPFRSVLIKFSNSKLDLDSLSLIEHAIEIYNSNFRNIIDVKALGPELYADYAFIDAELMRESLEQYNLINKNNAAWPKPAELLDLKI